ncbi:unnamed protein product [Arabidopsis thaliana]|uniref:(thale cress) hypothetical protein n=1 Tax=Arabidopsis thaliana TaxID=3702 RepID=A0A7G2F3Y9_ARATH|nr:unnamed protein product [Arabidopsis thaliana]
MTCHLSKSKVTVSPSIHSLICYGPDSGLRVYNPCTRRSIVLSKINSREKRLTHYIGYDPIDNGYKVLCVTSEKPEMRNKLGLTEELGSSDNGK